MTGRFLSTVSGAAANAGADVITNPGFETNTTGWDTNSSFWSNSGATLTRITTDSFAGTACGQVVTTGASNQQGANFRISSMAAATSYTIKVAVKWISGRPIRVAFEDATNSVTVASSFTSSASWQVVTLTVTTGASAVTSAILSIVTDGTAGISQFEIDEIHIAPTAAMTCTATMPGGTVGASAIAVLVAVNQSNASASTVTSVTDTAGNTYTKAASSTGAPNVAGDISVEIWYCLNPTTSSASQTYTVTLLAPAPSVAMRAVVLGSTTTLDTTATLAQSSAQNNSLALTTTASDDFVLTAIGVGADQSGAGTVISTSAPGDFPTVVASTGTASSSSSLYVIFESRPGARSVTQNFAQTASAKYVAAAASIKAPLSPTAPGTSGISLTTVQYKDPLAAVDYTFNWINWLSGTESISSAVVTSDPGISVDYYTVPAGNYVVAWLSGGVSGNSYTVTCSITTSLGRTDNRSTTITVQNQ